MIENWIFFFFFEKESSGWEKNRKTEREKKEIERKEELKGLERYMIDCLIYQWTFLFHILSECFSLLFFSFFFIHKLLNNTTRLIISLFHTQLKERIEKIKEKWKVSFLAHLMLQHFSSLSNRIVTLIDLIHKSFEKIH